MKATLGVLVVLVLILGVWLSLTMGRIEPAEQSGNATTTPSGFVAYDNSAYGFSLLYPEGYSVVEPYAYQALGPGRDIAGVKFVVPAEMATGTNLSPDSGISIEFLPGAVNSCSAEIYMSNPTYEGFVDENGKRFSVARGGGAGAGNRYEERVYATPIEGGCVGVRYFIHSTTVENYPEGTVREFDRAALVSQLDAIRKSLVLK
ncbi:MAG: hypothetical protein JWL87_123 [Candidatus Adlerbacteria bacterium]|nr:hypothetical protein [Candidatus Adlerbacteria bacterium]